MQVPSLIMDKSHYLSKNCFNPKREQIHSNEISWNLFSQGNFSRVANSFNLLPELVNVHQDKFVRLLIQEKNSATSLDRQRSYGAGHSVGEHGPMFSLVA